MANYEKGITIKFRAESTSMDKALGQIRRETKDLNTELRNIDKALKFNPTSVDLWKQKQQVLTQKIGETEQKLDVLKQAQADMDARGVDHASAEYRDLQREIITTESQLKNFNGQLKQIGNVNLRAASEQVKEMGNKLTSAGEAMRGISTAAAGVVASLGAISYKAGQNADDLNTLSKVYGLSTGDLQKYKTAADLVDVSVEDIAKSHIKLEKSMYSAQTGSKSAVAAFDALGISITDDSGHLRDADTVWQEAITALGKMENETERDAIAMQLMGKSAANLNPLIADQGETYKNVADTLAKYDLDFVDQATLDKANQFNDEIDTMKVLGSVALAQVGSQLASNLAPALEKVVDLVGKFANWLGNLDPAVLTTIGVIAGVVAAIAPVLMVLGKLAFAVSSIMSLMATIGPVIGAIAGPIGIAIAVIAAVVAAFVIWRKHGDKIKKFFADFGNKIANVWNGIKEAVLNAVEAVKSIVEAYFNLIKQIITTIVKGYVTLIKTEFNIIKTVITTVVNAVKTVVTTVFNAIKSFLTNVVKGYVALIRTEFNIAKTVVTTVVNAIKTVITTVFNAIKTAVTTIWNGIKTAIVTPIQAAKTTLTSIVSAIKNALSFSGIADTVRSAFNAVKDAITGPITKAKETLSGIVSKIKGFFPIKIGNLMSNIKLPHFSLKWDSKDFGKLGSIKYPTGFNVSWYAKGGIFNGPSVIGVGEAGSEAVVPLDTLWKKLDAIAAASKGGNTIIINGYDKDPRQLAEEVSRILIRDTNRRRLAWQ